MIYKNEEGTNVIQFGTGDIEVANGRVLEAKEKKMYPCLIFAAKKPGEIGKRCQPNKTSDPAELRDDVHTMFVFTDIRSFDVVIGNLQRARERFQKNGTAILSLQEIADEVSSQEYAQEDIMEKSKAGLIAANSIGDIVVPDVCLFDKDNKAVKWVDQPTNPENTTDQKPCSSCFDFSKDKCASYCGGCGRAFDR